MDILVRIEREDGNKCSCIIDLPRKFLVKGKYDDRYDEMVYSKIEDNIYFEGLGYTILELKEERIKTFVIGRPVRELLRHVHDGFDYNETVEKEDRVEIKLKLNPMYYWGVSDG